MCIECVNFFRLIVESFDLDPLMCFLSDEALPVLVDQAYKVGDTFVPELVFALNLLVDNAALVDYVLRNHGMARVNKALEEVDYHLFIQLYGLVLSRVVRELCKVKGRLNHGVIYQLVHNKAIWLMR